MEYRYMQSKCVDATLPAPCTTMFAKVRQKRPLCVPYAITLPGQRKK